LRISLIAQVSLKLQFYYQTEKNYYGRRFLTLPPPRIQTLC